jgi:hypothetical protein
MPPGAHNPERDAEDPRDQRRSRGRPGISIEPRHRIRTDETGLERVIFFSDAVFAIVITLLVLDLQIPASARDPASALSHLGRQLLNFAISFMVIGFTGSPTIAPTGSSGAMTCA